MEATLLGVPAIAVSLLDGGDLADGASAARLVAMRVLVSGLPRKTLLNVNVPPQTPRGIALTRLGHRVYSEKIVEQLDPRGRSHYWLGGGEPAWEALEGTDMGAIHEGLVSVSPVQLDLTNHAALARMGEWGPALSAQMKGHGRRP
jgi:5'-nucleotidase